MGQSSYTVGGFGIDAGEIDVEALEEDDRVAVVWYGDDVLGEDMGAILCVPGTDFSTSSRDYNPGDPRKLATPEMIDKMLTAIREAGLDSLADKTPKFITSEYFG